MLPASFELPAAIALVIGGAIACFAGYRLFRIVLGVYGFILGAMVTTSVMGTSNAWALVLAAAVGGLIGAGLMIAAYFVGIGLIGAGLASLVVHLAWRLVGTDPPTAVLVIMAVLGALGALSIARYVAVIGTALAGSWTLMVGALALAGHKFNSLSVTPDNVWVVYGAGPLPGNGWVIGGWVALALAGAVVQMTTTSRTGKAKKSGPRREGLNFTRLKLPFTTDAKFIRIGNTLLKGNDLGASAEGLIRKADGAIDITGTIIPAYGLNSAVSNIPLFGDILAGGKGQGIFGLTFAMGGTFAAPKFQVNPVSAIAPGILRKFFEYGVGPPNKPKVNDSHN